MQAPLRAIRAVRVERHIGALLVVHHEVVAPRRDPQEGVLAVVDAAIGIVQDGGGHEGGDDDGDDSYVPVLRRSSSSSFSSSNPSSESRSSFTRTRGGGSDRSGRR